MVLLHFPSYALDSKGGLDRGFQLYDDQFMPYLDGASELQLIRYGLRGLMRYGSPAWFPWLLERPAEQTIARATHWLNTYSERPAFLWVHLFEPHAPYEPHGLSGFNENGLPGHPVIDHRHILKMRTVLITQKRFKVSFVVFIKKKWLH